MLPKLKADAELMRYMPDRLPKGKQIERQYFWTCLNTLRPEYTKRLVENANRQSNVAGTAVTETENILVSDDWWQALNEMPFVSK